MVEHHPLPCGETTPHLDQVLWDDHLPVVGAMALTPAVEDQCLHSTVSVSTKFSTLSAPAEEGSVIRNFRNGRLETKSGGVAGYVVKVEYGFAFSFQ